MLMMDMLLSLIKLIYLPSLQSITRKSLPATTRRTASVVLKRMNTPAATSMLLGDGDTPRHILKNILLTGACTGLTFYTHCAVAVCCFLNCGLYRVIQSL